MEPYADRSYPPVGEWLSYERGDGAKIELRITPAAGTDGSNPPNATPQPVAAASLVFNPILAPPKPVVVAQRPGKVPIQQFSDDAILDHAAIGGKLTVFVLLYGGEEHFPLHEKWFAAFLATTPRSRIDLRVGSNALNRRSVDLVQRYVDYGAVTKHYRHTGNDYKYPVMREMFHDNDHPITTKWLLWFDDDSICDVDARWLNILCAHIAQNHRDKEAHMVGASFVWTTTTKQRAILESRPWYRRRPWRLQNGHPGGGNGTKIIFPTGGFWALTVEAMRAADIPDLGTGLTHNGGDWQIGEQLYQAGYSLKTFNTRKQFVRTSSVARRGVTTPLIDQVPQVADQMAPRHPAVPPRLRQLK